VNPVPLALETVTTWPFRYHPVTNRLIANTLDVENALTHVAVSTFDEMENDVIEHELEAVSCT
jgi:hypothetical protein